MSKQEVNFFVYREKSYIVWSGFHKLLIYEKYVTGIGHELFFVNDPK